MTTTAPPARRRRPGFTLVELLVVIVVLGILVALLVPAIIGAVRTANSAAVSADIGNLTNAIQAFKDRYGDFPPSRIYLIESGNYSVANFDRLFGAGNWNPVVRDRSLRFLRKFFNRVQLNTTTDAAVTGMSYDFNGNGVATRGGNPEFYVLEGHECLVFFLGGIPSYSGWVLDTSTTPATPIRWEKGAMSGFGRNPVNPFLGDQPPNGTTSRTTALFEFRADRLVDDDNDGIPGYVDSLARPTGSTLADARYFAYFLAYGANGYDPNDVNFSETDDTGSTTIGCAFRTAANISAAPNPYTTTPPVRVGQDPAFVNPNTYQILSAGLDRLYGPGGQYEPNSTSDRLPVSDVTILVPQDSSLRARERDNVTNFASGRLD